MTSLQKQKPAAEIQSVDVVYEESSLSQVTALSNVSFAIEDGEFVCVVGPSGCGKTTLLKLLAGFEKPTRGSVTVFGEKVSGPDASRAVVFQEHALFPWLTVRGNIEYGLKRRGIDKNERKELVRKYLALINLSDFKERYPNQLSGGMRQRVGIVRALINSPQILLMDEPFGALDALTRERLQDELVDIWQREKHTVLFITHAIGESLKLADKVIVMTARPGRIHTIIPVPFPRPRDIDSPEIAKIAHSIREILNPPGASIAGAAAKTSENGS